MMYNVIQNAEERQVLNGKYRVRAHGWILRAEPEGKKMRIVFVFETYVTGILSKVVVFCTLKQFVKEIERCKS